MKNYKRIMPIVLVGFFAVSVYSSLSSRIGLKLEYNNYINDARKFAKEGIIVDAVQSYENALQINDNIEVYHEIAKLYLDEKQYFDAVNWSETMIDKFPNECSGYELLALANYKMNRYEDSLEAIETAKKRKLESEEIDKIYEKLSKSYELTNRFEDVHAFYGGVASVYEGDMWHFVNYNGSNITGNEYNYTGTYSNELFPVIDDKNNAYFVDSEGNKKKNVAAIKNITEVGLCYEDYYTIKSNGSWYLYNLEGKKLSGPYRTISNISDGIVAVQNDKYKWFMMTADGKSKSDNLYEEILMDDNRMVYKNERLFIKEDSNCFMIDAKGNKFGEVYDYARCFNEEDSYAAVNQHNKWGFVDKDGKWLIKPKYQDARSFSNGYAAVKVDGKWGYINSKGTMIIDPKFDDVKDINQKAATFVKTESGWSLLTLYTMNK